MDAAGLLLASRFFAASLVPSGDAGGGDRRTGATRGSRCHGRPAGAGLFVLRAARRAGRRVERGAAIAWRSCSALDTRIADDTVVATEPVD